MGSGEAAEGTAGALAADTAPVGDPVRIRMSGVEVEGVITDASTPVMHVKLKATAVKAPPRTKRVRSV